MPGSLVWLARHELRLAWRDLVAVLLVRRGFRRVAALASFAAFAALLHGLAYGFLIDSVREGIRPDHETLVAVTGSLLLAWCLLASQAIEAVTRAFYARGDLDLILSSPTSSSRIFAVRICGIAASASLMGLLLVSPAANVLTWLDGPRWLAIYPVAVAMGISAAAVAVAVTSGLFRTVGPARTRAVAQVVAAVVGAAFAIAVQGVAILLYGDPSRLAALSSDVVRSRAPGPDSLVHAPARALMGEMGPMIALMAAALLLLGLAILWAAPRFARDALSTAGAGSKAREARRRPPVVVRRRSAARILREKEWTLLLRDPWLLSQSLMQVLYLIPAALLLWRYFGQGKTALPLLVPVLVMASGQLAGGLAWLAISGEDAPDLVRTAPVRPGQIVRAKIEAVLGAVGFAVAPLLVVVAIASPYVAAVAAGGIAISAASATSIQLWFRSQARRSNFRRRQTSSRVATFAEAFSSVLWACAAAFAAQGAWLLAAAIGAICLTMLGGTRAISPARLAPA